MTLDQLFDSCSPHNCQQNYQLIPLKTLLKALNVYYVNITASSPPLLMVKVVLSLIFSFKN